MRSEFNNRDFEQFVKQNADQYRMFPSEKVWQGIHNTLHSRRRRYGWGLALLLLLTGTAVTWVMTTTPVNRNSIADTVTKPITLSRPNVSQPEPSILENKPNTSIPGNSPLAFHAPLLDNSKNITPGVTPSEDIIADYPENPIAITKTPVVVERNNLPQLSPANLVSTADLVRPALNNLVAFQQPLNTEETPVNAEEQKTEVEKENLYTVPWTIESVINQYQKRRQKKLNWQLYFAPTISYRKLSDNKAFLREAANNGTASPFSVYNDVKNVVTHKPDIGLELGFAAKYSLSRALTVKAGLQFNVSRYDIKAFVYQSEVATIALNSGPSASASYSTVSNYRNFSNGALPDWLQNLYYSASLPVGAELKLTNKRASTYVGIGATVQPVYVIGERAYLISTDFKNYAEVPWLTRKWNVSTGFETFVGNDRGKLKWQIGPQVRYQMLSSFQNKYPVNENLFDFGLKLGIQLNQ